MVFNGLAVLFTLDLAVLLAAAPAEGQAGKAEVLFSADSFTTVQQALTEGWEAWSQRDEIRPEFFIAGQPSLDRSGSLGIGCVSNPLARGGWRRLVDGIEPGGFYRLEASYRVRGVSFPRQKVLARLGWLQKEGSGISLPVYVTDEVGRQGEWRTVAGTFQAPAGAYAVRVELFLGNAAQGTVWWDAIRLSRVPDPPTRPVRVGSVYARPQSKKNSAESIEEFCAVLEEAGRRDCDIVCLGEAINRIGVAGVTFPDAAQTVPGPATERLGQVARRFGMYIVAGFLERDGPGVYSSAVLIGRSGRVEGVYRRVYLSEVHTDQGVSPGNAYPVFDTDFGRIGIMTGYDSWSPDPARELTVQGAEIIFLPVWGDNETLIRARALENHVFLVLAAYDNVSKIYDPWGELLAEAGQRPGVAIADIDLNYPPACPFSYPQPDMRLRMLHERRIDIPSPLLNQ